MGDAKNILFAGCLPKIQIQANDSPFVAHIFTGGKWQRHRVGISQTSTFPSVFTLDVSFLDSDTATLG